MLLAACGGRVVGNQPEGDGAIDVDPREPPDQSTSDPTSSDDTVFPPPGYGCDRGQGEFVSADAKRTRVGECVWSLALPDFPDPQLKFGGGPTEWFAPPLLAGPDDCDGAGGRGWWPTFDAPEGFDTYEGRVHGHLCPLSCEEIAPGTETYRIPFVTFRPNFCNPLP